MPENQSAGGRSKFRRLKEEALTLLKTRHKEQIVAWADSNRSAIRALNSLLFHPEPLVRWRAAEAIGWSAAAVAARDMEDVRDLVRRFFWMMNDESGNLCRQSPEAIAEILVNVPSLIGRFGKMLASFLNEEPFEVGVRLALARIATPGRLEAEEIGTKLVDSLSDQNPEIRAASFLALSGINRETAALKAPSLADDSATIEIYDFDSGQMIKKSMAQMAQELIGRTNR